MLFVVLEFTLPPVENSHSLHVVPICYNEIQFNSNSSSRKASSEESTQLLGSTCSLANTNKRKKPIA